ncbi:hypothetical protein C2845_PM06G29540 [Panicum miliaceum]|uniref:UBC core domain-containing protein n=1 Tax=Panicum miliaceum TaxID=4540 RepID=A0A3L6RAB9_PANMI|nr:hypothetical protein C2845_PM06G29540 [Panicum miliaceum]
MIFHGSGMLSISVMHNSSRSSGVTAIRQSHPQITYDKGHELVYLRILTSTQVLLHEIAFVKPTSVHEILQELGDWVHDDDNTFDRSSQEDMRPQEPPSFDDYLMLTIQDNITDDHGGEGDDDSDSGSDNAEDDGPVGATAMDRVGNIIQAVIRRLSGMLAQGKMYMLSGRMVASASRAEPAMTENIQTCSPRICDDGDFPAALTRQDAGDDVFPFKHFDVVQSPQGHHYLDTKEQGGGGGRKWVKRVQKEWTIPETSLPDTIYLRAFEDRMDLLRAVMVGASGMPYHDGLFFFDLQLPPSYPATPPLVKYHSFGLRANPNLYPSGTVCLSLLNTFGGEGPELWSPESSSVLQVVVSIQGFVLTAQPYYNEAGYAAQVGTPEGRRNELPYCESTYLVNLRTMLHLVRRPTAGFEAFVVDHFRCRGQHVLRACKAYLQEVCPVGTLDGDARASATEVSRQRSCSMGFRLALAKVAPMLVDAFTGIGAQGCDVFGRLQVPPLCTAAVTS